MAALLETPYARSLLGAIKQSAVGYQVIRLLNSPARFYSKFPFAIAATQIAVNPMRRWGNVHLTNFCKNAKVTQC
jgi:hypothetical protein